MRGVGSPRRLRSVRVGLLAATATLALVACATQQEADPGVDSATTGESGTTTAPAADPAPVADPPEVGEYDLDQLLATLVRLEWIGLEGEALLDFLAHSTRATDALMKMHSFGPMGFRPGQSARLVSYRDGEVAGVVEQTLLAQDDQYESWRMRYTTGFDDAEAQYEVDVIDGGVPLELRFQPEGSNALAYVPTRMLVERDRLVAEGGRAEMQRLMSEFVAEELAETYRRAVPNAEVVGEQVVVVANAAYASVHVLVGGDGATQLHLHLSPHAPGYLVLAEAFVGEDTAPRFRTVLEVTEAATDTIFPDARRVTDDDLHLVQEEQERARLAANAWPSEGSVDAPVALSVGEPHFGSVAPGGASYYRIDVDRRSDVYIEMSETDGHAGIEYFATDASFDSWLSASSGGDPSQQITPALPGSYYLLVRDLDDDPLVGVSYSIAVRQDFVLIPTSVGSQEQIELHARSVRLGRAPEGHVELAETLRSDGVNVYRVRNPRAGTLRISMTPASQTLGVRWWGITSGAANSIGWRTTNDEGLVQISGLTTDAVGYFYVAGDLLLHAGQAFRLEVQIVPD